METFALETFAFTKFPGVQVARLLAKADRDPRHWATLQQEFQHVESNCGHGKKLVGGRDAGEEGSYDGWPA